MSKIDIKGLVEKYGRGFLSKDTQIDCTYYVFDYGYGYFVAERPDEPVRPLHKDFTSLFSEGDYKLIGADGVESTSPVYYDKDSFLSVENVHQEGKDAMVRMSKLRTKADENIKRDEQTLRIITKAISVNNSITFYPDNTIQLFSLESESEIEWDNTPENREIIEQYLDALVVVKEIQSASD